MNATPATATFTLGASGEDPMTVRRLGFGAMRITGPGIWGDPADLDVAQRQEADSEGVPPQVCVCCVLCLCFTFHFFIVLHVVNIVV